MFEAANHEPEHDAMLFNAAARLLGRIGYRDIEFDVGGKKSRRRYICATSVSGERQVIWVKASTRWPELGEAVRFPWKKLKGPPDGERAIAVACAEAQQRGATHLLALSGDSEQGSLSAAQLYPLSIIPDVVSQQASVTNSVFYRAHSSSLILKSVGEELAAASDIAAARSTDLLAVVVPAAPSTPARAPVSKEARGFVRNPRVRGAVLKIASGRCECCGEIGFVTAAGDHYLETHHVVGVGERGPDAEANIVALCPLCHRKVHFAADRLAIERKLMEVLRRRPRPKREV